MARAIDADYLMERLNKKKAGPANKRYTEGFNDCLMRVRSMVHSMPTLTPPNEWVSVNKRLPEKRKDVLVHYGNGRIGIDWIDSTQCFVFDELYGRVTHWLPIPELPDRRPPEEEA